MRRLLVLVEGQTEETFVRDVLDPHLHAFEITAIPTILRTKRVKAGPDFKGGVTSGQQVMRDLRALLSDTNAIGVTSVLDYYGLPPDFPGIGDRPPGNPTRRVDHVESAWAGAIADRRFIPHLVLHEYEAWIYADPQASAWVFDDGSIPGKLLAVRAAVRDPEQIDEGPTTAPSKRLSAAFPGYQKTLHGPLAVGAIGLARIRAECPHAAAWLARLEGL